MAEETWPTWEEVRAEDKAAGRLDEARVAEHRERMRAEQRAYRLAEIRRQHGLTQTDVAASMHVSQRRVSAVEHGDLSRTEFGTVASYVEAIGGKVEIVADFGDERFVIGLQSAEGLGLHGGCRFRGVAWGFPMQSSAEPLGERLDGCPVGRERRPVLVLPPRRTAHPCAELAVRGHLERALAGLPLHLGGRSPVHPAHVTAGDGEAPARLAVPAVCPASACLADLGHGLIVRRGRFHSPACGGRFHRRALSAPVSSCPGAYSSSQRGHV